MAGARPVVFITGASSGIGAACVEVFAENGWTVIAAARRVHKLEQLSEAIRERASDRDILPLSCDVTRTESVREAFSIVAERYGRIDALINNAGIGTYGCVAVTDLNEFHANMETNYFGVLRCTQAAMPLLRAAVRTKPSGWGASIITVSSFCGRRSVPEFAAYGASKYAVEGLCESLRLELKQERISVSVVNPGVVKTEFFGTARGTRPAAYVPPKRGMTGRAVAQVILKLTRHPKRNVYLTWACKAGVFFQWVAPRIFDYVLWRAWRKER